MPELEELKQQNNGADQYVYVERDVVTNKIIIITETEAAAIFTNKNRPLPSEKKLLSVIADELRDKKYGRSFCCQSDYHWVKDDSETSDTGQKRISGMHIYVRDNEVFGEVRDEVGKVKDTMVYLSYEDMLAKRVEKTNEHGVRPPLSMEKRHFYYGLENQLYCECRHRFEIYSWNECAKSYSLNLNIQPHQRDVFFLSRGHEKKIFVLKEHFAALLDAKGTLRVASKRQHVSSEKSMEPTRKKRRILIPQGNSSDTERSLSSRQDAKTTPTQLPFQYSPPPQMAPVTTKLPPITSLLDQFGVISSTSSQSRQSQMQLPSPQSETRPPSLQSETQSQSPQAEPQLQS